MVRPQSEVYAGSTGRLLSQTDANGQTLSFTYNGAGLLSSSTTPADVVTYYDNDGLTTGSLSENQYDAAGRLTAQTQRTQFANASQIGQITSAATTLAQVRPSDGSADRKALNFYNARGQLVAQLDGEGGFSETLRYSLKATGLNTASVLSSIKAAAGGVQSQTVYEYDLLNRVLKQRVD